MCEQFLENAAYTAHVSESFKSSHVDLKFELRLFCYWFEDPRRNDKNLSIYDMSITISMETPQSKSVY